MPKLIYTPKALDDLQGIKAYVAKQFGEGKARSCVKVEYEVMIENKK